MAVGRLGEHFIAETDVEPLTLPVSGQGMEDEAEGPALPDEAPSIPWPEDELVTRCLGDLIDDWQRKGGRLSYDDVTRMSTKRKLDGRQLASLLEALTRAGVTIAGLQSPAPEQHAVVDPDEEMADETTPAGRDALGAYLAEISRYPLLWAEDEVRLGRLIKAGQEAEVTLSEEPTRSLDKALITQLRNAYEAGRRAHDQLVLSNLRLVVSVAKQGRYARSGLDLIDRIQDGNIGLMRAADKFDYTMGYKFSTYAMWWIRQSIERGIGDNSRLIRLPVYFHERLVKVLRAQRRLAEKYDHEPSLSELAQATDLDPGTVQGILDWAKPVMSLDQIVVQDGDLSLGDLLDARADIDGRGDPADVVLEAARLRSIEEVLGEVLDARSAMIIRRRFGIGADEETLEAIGKDLKVTRERVRQLEVKALKMLTGAAVGRGLHEYLVTEGRFPVARPSAPLKEAGESANPQPADGSGDVNVDEDMADIETEPGI